MSDGNSHDYKVVIINSTPGNISPERSIQFFFDNEPLNYPIDLTDNENVRQFLTSSIFDFQTMFRTSYKAAQSIT